MYWTKSAEKPVRPSGKPVQVANDNSPGQIVISGDNAALEKAMELAKARGAKRAIKLAVSIAAHSKLMAVAARSFRGALDAVTFAPANVPVVGNVYARPIDRSTSAMNWKRSSPRPCAGPKRCNIWRSRV